MKKKLMMITIAMVLLVLTATACSAPTYDMATESKEEPAAEAQADSTYDLYEDDMYEGEMYEEAAPEAAAGMASTPEEVTGEDGGLGSLPNSTMPDTNRKLVYSASFSIETKQFQEDYSAIRDALSKVGGYVEYEDSSQNNTDYGVSLYTQMTLRIPADKYESFLDTLSGVGTVTNKNISTEDISSNYFDTEARIEILEESRQRLMGHLQAATDAETIIALESELSDVLYELDNLKGNRRHMDNLVEYTRVEVSMTEVLTATAIDPVVDPLADRTQTAWSLSMNNMANFLENFAIGFVAASPVLILLGIIGVVTFVIIKLVQKMRKKLALHKEKNRPTQSDTL